MFRLVQVLGLTLTLPLVAQAPEPAKPRLPEGIQNGTFQKDAVGQPPSDWFVPKVSRELGFKAETSEDAQLPGRRCAKLVFTGGNKPTWRDFGNLMQSIDAKPYRGKRIRLKTQLRLGALDPDRPSPIQMWFRVDRVGQKMGFFDNMDSRPVLAAAWTPAEIIGDVAQDAEALALGVMLPHGGLQAWIGPVTLEILGDTPILRAEGPKVLSPRGMENLGALAVVLNRVRYFHPSDEAAKADWNRLASEGVKAVEGAATPKALALRLQRFFAPLAPGARFMVGGKAPVAAPVPADAVLAVRWNHLGLGQNNANIYKSLREYAPITDWKSKGWRDPASPETVQLAGGVQAVLPTVCVANEAKHTLPRTAPVVDSLPAGLPEPTTGFFSTADDRATRLGDVILAWGVFQHFYPYFDVVKTDWPRELTKALHAAALDKDASAFTHTLKRMTATLKDGHVWVSASDQDDPSVPALGLVVIDGLPVIRSAEGTAKHLPLGSRILSVDGEPSGKRLARMKEEISAAGEGWMNHRLASEFLAGETGTRVRLTYVTATGFPGQATVVRDAKYWLLENGQPATKVGELRPGIWYLDLNRISEKEFEAALPNLAQAKGVVFDLRGYPKMGPAFLQHLTDKPLESARWNKPQITQPDGKGWTWDSSGRWNLEPLAPRIQGKVAFLTGGGAISYAESCLGIVEAYKLAEIVGEPTAGTNGNVNPFSLPGGFTISWTGMKVLKHDGSTHHGVGIQPTLPVRPTVQGLAQGRDEVLEKGLEQVSR